MITQNLIPTAPARQTSAGTATPKTQVIVITDDSYGDDWISAQYREVERLVRHVFPSAYLQYGLDDVDQALQDLSDYANQGNPELLDNPQEAADKIIAQIFEERMETPHRVTHRMLVSDLFRAAEGRVA
jgi:hypothetical protein